MRKIFITILFLILVIPTISFAADMSLTAEKNTFGIDEDFAVKVMLDTKDVKVNALEGIVSFPSQLLELREVRDGNSSVNFWVEKPHIAKDGEIIFSGITTGGFSGSNRFLFDLVFHTKKIGNGVIDLSKIQVLENDGLGTKVLTTKDLFKFSILEESKGPLQDLKIEDTTSPEDFNLFIGQDSTTFDGKYFLVFSTVDKGSGIDHYEVRESLLGFDGKYIVAESPYLLDDQTLKRTISVIAFDKNGNKKIEKIGPQNKLAWFLQLIIFAIILSVCVFVSKKIWSRLYRK